MIIKSKDYQVADIQNNRQAISIIERAEAEMANLIGESITLIAYSKYEEQSKH